VTVEEIEDMSVGSLGTELRSKKPEATPRLVLMDYRTAVLKQQLPSEGQRERCPENPGLLLQPLDGGGLVVDRLAGARDDLGFSCLGCDAGHGMMSLTTPLL